MTVVKRERTEGRADTVIGRCYLTEKVRKDTKRKWKTKSGVNNTEFLSNPLVAEIEVTQETPEFGLCVV